MNQEDKKLLCDYYLDNGVTDDKLLKHFGVKNTQIDNLIIQGLDCAMRTKDSELVSYIMYLCFRFDVTSNIIPSLCKLLMNDFHEEHEDIASLLQDFRDPCSVDALYEAALMKLPYLIEIDEQFNLARICIWALSDINTDTSIAKLGKIANIDSNINPIIRTYAKKRLASIGSNEHTKRIEYFTKK